MVANRTTTNVHLHMLVGFPHSRRSGRGCGGGTHVPARLPASLQITQTGYDSMLAFINKIRTSPASVFTPALFGTTVITVEPWSAKLTLVPNPVALLPPPGAPLLRAGRG